MNKYTNKLVEAMKDKWHGDKFLKLYQQLFTKRIRKASSIVVTSAKLLCPVRKGNLRKSIIASPPWQHQSSKIIISEIGTNVEYAPHIEFGTVKMSARPYLRPALKGNRQGVIRILKGGV